MNSQAAVAVVATTIGIAVLSSLLSPYINGSPLSTVADNTLIIIMISAIRECNMLTLVISGLSAMTMLCYLFLTCYNETLLNVGRFVGYANNVAHCGVTRSAATSWSTFASSFSATPAACDDADVLRVTVPFIVIRDTVAITVGGLTSSNKRKPVQRVLQDALLGYQTDMSQALGGLSRMLERALVLEDAFLGDNGMGHGDNHGNSSRSANVQTNPFPMSARLSTRIQERIRRSAVCLEEDEQMLQHLLGTFNYVLALPDNGMVQEHEVDASRDATLPTNLSREGENRPPQAVHDRRQVPLPRSHHPAAESTRFTTGGPSLSGDRTSIPELHSYDSASQIVAHIVRDWTVIGQPIRRSLYDWCCHQVDEFIATNRTNGWTNSDRSVSSGVSILVPGAGMGRLAYDLYQRGHNVEANELSPSMAAAASAILQRNVRGVLHPYVLDAMANEVDSNRRYDAVRFPDLDFQARFGRQATAKGTLSYTVGSFVGSSEDSYYQMRSGQFDAVVTCFFIDTASNPYEYIDMIQSVLKPGVGVWINVGPVQWHQNAQLRPSVDELRDLLLALGWSIKLWSIDRTPVSYRESEDDLVRATNYDGYRPLRFVAVRTSGHG